MKYSARKGMNSFCHTRGELSFSFCGRILMKTASNCLAVYFLFVEIVILKGTIFQLTDLIPFLLITMKHAGSGKSDEKYCLLNNHITVILFFFSQNLSASSCLLRLPIFFELFDDFMSSLLNRYSGWPVRNWSPRGHVLVLWSGKATPMKHCWQTLTGSTSGG